MSFRVVFLAVLLVVVVGGGAMAYLGWERFQSAQESTTANAEVCGALKARERRALLGVPSPTRQDRLEGVNAEFTCRWSPKNADPTKHLIEVVSTPARHWADGLATSVDSATGMFQPGALDPARMESLKVLARNADQLGDREACALAGTTFEMSGARRRLRRW